MIICFCGGFVNEIAASGVRILKSAARGRSQSEEGDLGGIERRAAVAQVEGEIRTQ